MAAELCLKCFCLLSWKAEDPVDEPVRDVG